jgi:hypothetical protein
MDTLPEDMGDTLSEFTKVWEKYLADQAAGIEASNNAASAAGAISGSSYAGMIQSLFKGDLSISDLSSEILSNIARVIIPYGSTQHPQLKSVLGEGNWADFMPKIESFRSFASNALQLPNIWGSGSMLPGAYALRSLSSSNIDSLQINDLTNAIYKLDGILTEEGKKPSVSVTLPPATGDVVTDLLNAVSYLNALSGV